MSEAGAETPDAYRTQIRRWARALAGARDEAVAGDLDAGSSRARLALFTDDLRAKRRERLGAYLDFVAEAFDDFDDLLNSYLRARAAPAYATTTDDAERFLRWLARTRGLTPEQRDYVVSQRARHAVEAAARADRAGHLRFQALWEATEPRLGELGVHPGLRLHLNPLRVWSRLRTTALLDDDACPPANVLSFAVRDSIHVAVLERSGRIGVQALATRGPCGLDEWSNPRRRTARIELGRDLAAMGLVALELVGDRSTVFAPRSPVEEADVFYEGTDVKPQ